MYYRQPPATRLLRRAECDLVPPVEFGGVLTSLKPHNTLVANNRYNVANPEFRGLLNNDVHFLLAGNGLDQGNLHGRLRLRNLSQYRKTGLFTGYFHYADNSLSA